MTQIRVHELASELNVSTQQVMSLLEDLGKKVRGPSTVIGASDAAKVRARSRASKVQAAGPTAVAEPAGAGRPVVADAPGVLSQSLFLPPVAPPTAPTVTRSTAAFANPFALPTAGAAAAPPTTTAAPSAASAVPPVPAQSHGVVNRVAPEPTELVVEQPDHAAGWERRGFSEAEQEVWRAGGLRPAEAELAGRCQAVGIAPSELSMKLSGRTSLQRLRDGEATTSVWARIREAEQQPGRAGTKLTGRFQLS